MILLDTNVISELMRREPSARVVAWMEVQPRSRLGITAITQAEILYGIELLPKGRRKQGLLQCRPGNVFGGLPGSNFPIQ